MTYSVGIIGTGFGSKVHLPGFIEHPSFDVKAIAGRNEEKTLEIAKKAGIEGTTDWTELIRSDLDVIAITPPPFLHYEMAKAVLLSEKHLLLEKPTTHNALQAKELVSMALNAELIGMMSHEFRWTPSRNYFRHLLLEDKIVGDIQEIHYHNYMSFATNNLNPPFGWLWDSRFEGGMLGAIGSHLIDQIRSTTNLEFKELSGYISTITKQRRDQNEIMQFVTADDGFGLHGKMENDVLVNLTVSTTIRQNIPSHFLISGTENSIYLENDKIFYCDGGNYTEKAIPEKFQIDDSLKDKDRRLPAFMKLLDLLAMSLNDEISYSPNLTDGWKNQQVVDAVRESHKFGSRIRITD